MMGTKSGASRFDPLEAVRTFPLVKGGCDVVTAVTEQHQSRVARGCRDTTGKVLAPEAVCPGTPSSSLGPFQPRKTTPAPVALPPLLRGL